MTADEMSEIDKLVCDVSCAKNHLQQVTGKHVDKGISEFAKEATNDFIENRNKLLKVIRNNPEVFIDYDSFEVSIAGPSTEGYKARNGERFSYSIGGLDLILRLKHYSSFKDTGYRVMFNNPDIEFLDVKLYKGVYGNQSDNEEKTCCMHDTVDFPDATACKTPFDYPRTAAEWRHLYCLSTWTRAKNVLMVRRFKQMLKEKSDRLNSMAQDAEKFFELNRDVNRYEKVKI